MTRVNDMEAYKNLLDDSMNHLIGETHCQLDKQGGREVERQAA